MFFIQLRLVAIAAFSVRTNRQAKCMLMRRLRTSVQVPAAFTGRAAPRFCHGPHNNTRFKPLFGIHQFETTVFVFQLLQGGRSWRHPSRQTVNASHRTGIVHSMLAAQFSHRHSDSSCFWMTEFYLSVKHDFFINIRRSSPRDILPMHIPVFRGGLSSLHFTRSTVTHIPNSEPTKLSS